MVDELDAVSQFYAAKSGYPLSVQTFRNVTTQELYEVFASEFNHIHYIGHIDPEGFRCRDGWICVPDMNISNLSSFFLNACSSFEQAKELVKNGAVGGVATLNEVINTSAVRLGTTLTQLLANGFPLQVALGLASYRNVISDQYTIVGNGNINLGPANLIANYAVVEDVPDGEGFNITVQNYISEWGFGGTNVMWTGRDEELKLIGQGHHITNLPEDQFNKFLNAQTIPVLYDEEFYWSDEFDPSKIR